MSAFMVNNRTLSKIAKYMEACANHQIGGTKGGWELEFDSEFKKLLSDEGLVDATTGMFSASLFHAFLYKRNRRALLLRDGAEATEEMCPSESEPMEDGGTAIDISFETRREWLANLYTVCRCYAYQIAEGDYREDWFYRKFAGWIRQIAAALANYVVNEVRPYKPGCPFKPWDVF